MSEPLPGITVPTSTSRFNVPAGAGFVQWFDAIKQSIGVVLQEFENRIPAKLRAELAKIDLVYGGDARLPAAVSSSAGYAYVMTDNDENILLGVKSDGTTVFNNPPAPFSPTEIPLSSGYVYVLTDLDGNILYGVRADGTIAGTVDKALNVPAGGGVGPPAGGAFQPSEIALSSGYIYVLTDLEDNIIYGIRADTTIAGTIDRALNVPTSAFDPSQYLVSSTGPVGAKRITLSTLSTGSQKVLTSGSNDTNPRLRSDGLVIFDRADVERYIPYTGGEVHQTVAGPHITTWGDSLTQANAWQTRLREILPGVTITNEGIGSQTSEHIAARQGGRPVKLTIEGGVIPASGPVTAAPDTIILMTTNYPARSTTGTLSGVHGTLSYAGGAGTPYTFTRTTAGVAVPVAGPTEFYTDSQYVGENRIVTLWTGRNNPWTDVVGDTEKMVKRLRSMVKRYLVFSTTTATTEVTGSNAHTRITLINNLQRQKYGDFRAGGNFVDLQAEIISRGLQLMNVTPTEADQTALAGNTLPPSVMLGTDASRDSIHFNNDAQRLIIAPLVHEALTLKGWI